MGASLTAEFFDYIVVGAGSAGCVIAARLSENQRHSVLLLEAGGRDSNPWIHVPMGFAKTFFDDKVNWCFTAEPSKELNDRKLFAPGGKVLGGSSSINGLVYLRGQKEDFDEWKKSGNSGWGYDDVLPYFRKSEDYQKGADEFHGSGGPLRISELAEQNPYSRSFVESAVAAGHPRNPDLNGASQEGVGPFQVTASGGRRMSSAVAFLRDAERRPNVAVRTNAEVDNLITEDGKVVGVSYVLGTETRVARATRSVVLSAGSLNTPAILQRSGIGRGDWLMEAGIAVKHELSGVGANLQDHIQSRLVLRSRRYPTLNSQTRNPIGLVRMALEYGLLRRGPLSSAGGQSGGFVRSRPDVDRPDILFFVMPFSSQDLRKGLDRFPAFTVASSLLRPESRGTVRVTSADRKRAPSIRPNYLEAELDRRTMIDGLRAARRITAMRPLRDEIEREERPGLDMESDDQLLSYIRETASSVYHPSGTCKMGGDADAVVDARLRLRGMDGLTVADASIMPTIVSSPTNATAIMIGERAAAFLLAAK
jgi:choline dehydrogenase